jgi:hypothetical protein
MKATLATALLSLASVACGTVEVPTEAAQATKEGPANAVGKAPAPNDSEPISFSVKSASTLPNCNPSREAQVAVALDTRAVFVCQSGEWVALELTGKDGRDGKDGVNGVDGKDGKDGAQGPAGERGEKGDKGEQGERGEQGTAGLNGADGRDGVDGVNGTNGTNGVDGQDGAPGETLVPVYSRDVRGSISRANGVTWWMSYAVTVFQSGLLYAEAELQDPATGRVYRAHRWLRPDSAYYVNGYVPVRVDAATNPEAPEFFHIGFQRTTGDEAARCRREDSNGITVWGGCVAERVN